MNATIETIDWDKMQGLVPAIIQDAVSGAVLMLGYMNREAFDVTQTSGRVTFWSRSKQRLWTKGESSGHWLELRSIAVDCDGDTLLILATPHGPACHLGHHHVFSASTRRSHQRGAALFWANSTPSSKSGLHRVPPASYNREIDRRGRAAHCSESR